MAFVFSVEQFMVADRVDRGCYFMQQNRYVEAVAEFDVALAINPTERYARWNRCIAMLSLGDYVRGLPEHDCAWDLFDWRALGPVQGNVDRVFRLPIWRAERCHLLVYHEMGMGDAIMLMRFLPELVERCDSVTLIVRPELVSLMQGYGANVVGAVPEDMSKFDARVTFFNIIWTLGHMLQTIPSAPYIKADFKFTGGKIGIAWSGNSRMEFTLQTFLSQLDTSGFKLFALQKTPVIPAEIIPLPTEWNFKDTAGLMSELDVIVTVDTAAAHLAGAMGHPNAHLVLPYLRDWRWWNKDVWYPTLNIYPQETPSSWDAPFTKLNAVLASIN